MSREYRNEFLDWESNQDREELFKRFLKLRDIPYQEYQEFLMQEYEEQKQGQNEYLNETRLKE